VRKSSRFNFVILSMKKQKPVLDKSLFWDVTIEEKDFDRYSGFIITRVFERGDFDSIRKIRRYYGDVKIKKELVKCKYIEQETLNFLSLYYDIPIENFKCYTNKQLRGPHSLY
jgi:hypothetical protein